MRVSDLTRQKIVSATVDLGDGDVVELTFDRNKITPAWVADASKRDDERDMMSLPKALADVVVAWDVTNDDGSPFPPTVENVAVLGYASLSTLLTRIVEASAPSDAEGKASGATSPSASIDSTPTLVTHPNGQATSASPVPSASPSPT